jgi:hypothetical protein
VEFEFGVGRDTGILVGGVGGEREDVRWDGGIPRNYHYIHEEHIIIA